MIANQAQHTPIDRVRVLQRKLYLSAKQDRGRRYGILFDKVIRPDVLEKAWQQVAENAGAPGVDEQTIESIRDSGVKVFLDELGQEIQKGTYWPRPVRRRWIPKGDGRKRPLGIPTVKDRVVQAAVKLVIEPIFEAQFQPFSHGFRPQRSPLHAVQEVRRYIVKGWHQVIEVDFKSYFDTIPHENLMKLVEQRVSDPRILKLIRAWLKAGVMEDEFISPTEMGSPQGALGEHLSGCTGPALGPVRFTRGGQTGPLL